MKIPHVEAAVFKRDARSMTASRPELLIDGSDTAFRQMVHDLLAFAGRMQETRARVAASINLSGHQYTMLLAIAQQRDRDGFGIIQLAEYLRLSGPFVTIEVNKLVAAGLVRKRQNMSDRRRVLLNLTPHAHALLETVTWVQQPSNDTIFGSLSRDEFEILRRIVPTLVEASDQSLKLIDFLTSAGPQRSVPA